MLVLDCRTLATQARGTMAPREMFEQAKAISEELGDRLGAAIVVRRRGIRMGKRKKKWCLLVLAQSPLYPPCAALASQALSRSAPCCSSSSRYCRCTTYRMAVAARHVNHLSYNHSLVSFTHVHFATQHCHVP
jgi:hypothetical protein